MKLKRGKDQTYGSQFFNFATEPSILGALLQTGDNYSTIYDHNTYTQTNGEVKPIRNDKGQFKGSKQAQKALQGSRLLLGLSLVANLYTVYNGVDNYNQNGLTLRNGLDMAIGGAGAVAVGIILFSNPVGWVATVCAAAGYVSAAYGTTSLAFDVYNKFSN